MRRMVWFAALMLVLPGRLPAADADPLRGSVFLDAEDFSQRGSWWFRPEAMDVSNKLVLAVFEDSKGHDGAPDPVRSAATVVDIPEAGEYFFWVRSQGSESAPGSRAFRLTVNGAELGGTLGAHSREGYFWENAGKVALPRGVAVLGLESSAQSAPRIDAIFLTPAKRSPNDLPLKRLMTYRPNLLPVATPAWQWFPAAADGRIPPGAEPVAGLENASLRVGFFSTLRRDGSPLVLRRTEVKAASGWVQVQETNGREILFLISSPDASVKFRPWPLWEAAHPEKTAVDVRGTKIPVWPEATDPFTAGNVSAFTPVSVEQSGREVVVHWKSEQAAVSTRWSLPDGEKWVVDVRLDFAAPAAAWYSFGFLAFGPFAEGFASVFAPPFVQQRRVPDRPLLYPSSQMSVPFAQVESLPIEGLGGPVSFSVAANPSSLPFRWAQSRNSVYGFSLLNPRFAVQPAVFTPVLGFAGSWKAEGERIEASWKLAAVPGSWEQGFGFVADDVFRVRDYRSPTTGSLTDALLNMTDLMQSEDGGWDEENKGFWDIETPNMAKQAEPLAVLSAAMLARDEKFFAARALPTLEFSLSRKLAWHVPGLAGAEDLSVPSQFWGASYWIGVDRLFLGLNPWLSEFFTKDGAIRISRTFNTAPPWTEELELHRKNPDAVPLAKITADAKAWIAEQFASPPPGAWNFYSFYNHANYPYWFDLVDLYELTKDPEILAAAESGAHFSMAGQWVHPSHPEGMVTIQKNGVIHRPVKNWYKGGKTFRLGITDNPVEVKEEPVEAWKVSPVGLSLETPTTFFQEDDVMANITSMNWAPNLVRLYGITGNERYRTFARNALIGRYANYPGYYHADFSTVWQNPRFPYTGPDVTNIYYHHIAMHYAMTLDFLIADVETRSGNAISFPYAKQKNYLWFTNRIYGLEPGVVYGQKGMRLWIARGLAAPDTVAVDWLAAENDDAAAVMFLNQGHEPVTFLPHLGLDRLGWTDGQELEMITASSGARSTVKASPDLSLTLPPREMVVLIGKRAVRVPPVFAGMVPLQSGHSVHPLPAPWNRAHVFRIRSPFGHDAVYVLVENEPGDHGTLQFELAGAEPQEEAEYPYEGSFYPVDPQTPAALRIVEKSTGKTLLATEVPAR